MKNGSPVFFGSVSRCTYVMLGISSVVDREKIKKGDFGHFRPIFTKVQFLIWRKNRLFLGFIDILLYK